ncbi:LysE family translocator [Tahibacter amnicola]|uniref:LysE family translocator n=1 Tax=Tahibacter amnicola TaxID=2976241 RepID=A0ABY6BPX0_9GAMM|nr:LysE family translocator [Tahibacter amnicola]UXI70465.1 LysE family translocator [Tahibacter amnicola]
MFAIENYASFVMAILAFQAIPGPGTLAILNATARGGVRAGMGAVLGTLLGDAVFMLAAVAGLAAVMSAHPVLFQALQWFGAAYLCWMGFQLLRATVSDEVTPAASTASAAVYLRRALAVSFTNPKVVLFFVAFFPLFLRPDSSRMTLVAMMLHVTVLSFLYQALLVLVGNAMALRLRGLPLARTVATRLAGVSLIGFGVKLAANQR